MALWAGLHCQLHVLIDVLLDNLCSDQSLGLEIKRISIHHPDPLSFSFSPDTLLLFQHLCKLLQITTLKSLSQPRIVLFKQGQLVWVCFKHFSDPGRILLIPWLLTCSCSSCCS